MLPESHSIASGLSLQKPSSGTFPKNKELISSGGVPSQSSGFATQYSPPSSKALPKNYYKMNCGNIVKNTENRFYLNEKIY